MQRMSWLMGVVLCITPWTMAADDAPEAAGESAATKAEEAVEAPGGLATDKERLSYSIGMNIGNGLARESLDVDVDLIAQAIKDIMAGNDTKLTDEQARQTIMDWQKKRRADRQKELEAAAAKNKEEGQKWLAENAKKEGVKTTESGLQYRIVEPGEGESPASTDRVTVHYRGRLLDGTEFDSSYKRGRPATFAVTGVIKGWTEALQMMKPGAKWELFIPSDLAYGERGGGPKIGPNATLLFDVELISVEEPATKPAGGPGQKPSRRIEIDRAQTQPSDG